MICIHTPIAEQIHASLRSTFNIQIRLEPASLSTCPSGCNITPCQNGFEHSCDVVIPIGRGLFGDRTLHTIAHQEHAHMRPFALGQIHCHAQSVIRTFVSIRPIIDDEKIFFVFSFCHVIFSFSVYYLRATATSDSRFSNSTCRIRSQACVILELLNR